jgi:hypothetical protein
MASNSMQVLDQVMYDSPNTTAIANELQEWEKYKKDFNQTLTAAKQEAQNYDRGCYPAIKQKIVDNRNAIYAITGILVFIEVSAGLLAILIYFTSKIDGVPSV